MNWPIDEFLGLIDVRGVSWCVIDMSTNSAFRIPHGAFAYIHLVVEGRVRLTGASGQPLDLATGDVAIQISGDMHKIRCGMARTTRIVEELASDVRKDVPLVAEIGEGQRSGRLLSGRLKILWPGGYQPARLPGTLTLRADDVGIDVAKLPGFLSAAGATAMLNRAAGLLFVQAFRATPYCRAHLQWNLRDPIVRAKVLIEKHPFTDWSVRALADRVGMGRSNFAARFVAQTGKTPIGALIEERMKYAETFLRDTDLKISEVGEKVGYHSEAAFVRQFTRHFRITPSKLRKQALSRVQ